MQMLKTDVWTSWQRSRFNSNLRCVYLSIEARFYHAQLWSLSHALILDIAAITLSQTQFVIKALETCIFHQQHLKYARHIWSRAPTFPCIIDEKAAKCCLFVDVMCNIRAVKDWPESSRLYFIHVYCSGVLCIAVHAELVAVRRLCNICRARRGVRGDVSIRQPKDGIVL